MENENQNNYFIKLQGRANIPEPLIIDQNYHIAADCSVVQEKKDSNENGSYDITFHANPVTVEILKANGAIIRAKDPRRNSAKLRNYLFKCYANEGYTEDFSSVYDEFTLVVMSRTPEMLLETIKRLNDKTSS